MTSETVAAGASSLSNVRRKQITVAIAIIICLALDAFLAWRSRIPVSNGSTDFISSYSAGQFVANGNGIGLFTRSVLVNAPFVHAPYEALLFVPFAHLPYATAAWLWCILNILLSYLILFLLLQDLPGVRARPELAVLAVGLFMPVLITEFNGQDSLLTLLMFSLCFRNLMRDRAAIAGCALAVACFKPPLALPMLVLITATSRKRWAFLSGFGATACVLFLLSVAAVGWNGIFQYLRFLREYAALAEPYHVYDMPNVRGLTTALFQGYVTNSVIQFVVSAASLLVLALTIVVARRAGRELQALSFALFVTATILVAFHEFAYDLVLLILPIFLVWNWSATRAGENLSRNWMRFAPPILICGSIAVSFKAPAYNCTIVLLFLLLCRELLESRSSKVEDGEPLQAAV